MTKKDILNFVESGAAAAPAQEAAAAAPAPSLRPPKLLLPRGSTRCTHGRAHTRTGRGGAGTNACAGRRRRPASRWSR